MKRKRTNYQFRLMSNIKTWWIGILVAIVAVLGATLTYSFRESNMWQSRYITAEVEKVEEEAKVDATTALWKPTLDTLIEGNTYLAEKLELELRKPNERLGTWEIYTFSAYTSQDEGVNNISSIGLDIGKYSMYMRFVAVAGDSYIEYGDIILVRDFPGSTGITAFIAVDTGGALVVGEEDKAEIDVYMGNDLKAAFEFGIQRLEVWVIK